MPDRFGRFTDRARRVLTLAQEEAQRFNHNYIGTEHLLLAILVEGNGVAVKVLQDLGVDVRKVRTAIEFIIGRGEGENATEIGLTPGGKRAIELALEEARLLNLSYVGTEHLLLGLVREGEGVAFGVLESLGVSLERVRVETVRLLSPRIPRVDLELMPLIGDEHARKRAAEACDHARAALSNYRGSLVEEAMIFSLAVPHLDRVRDGLSMRVPEAERGDRKQELRILLGPLIQIERALRQQGNIEAADPLMAAITALAQAFR